MRKFLALSLFVSSLLIAPMIFGCGNSPQLPEAGAPEVATESNETPVSSDPQPPAVPSVRMTFDEIVSVDVDDRESVFATVHKRDLIKARNDSTDKKKVNEIMHKLSLDLANSMQIDFDSQQFRDLTAKQLDKQGFSDYDKSKPQDYFKDLALQFHFLTTAIEEELEFRQK